MGRFALCFWNFLKVFGVKILKMSSVPFFKMCDQLFELNLHKLNFYIMIRGWEVGQEVLYILLFLNFIGFFFPLVESSQ